MIKSRSMRWVGRVERVEETRNVYTILVGEVQREWIGIDISEEHAASIFRAINKSCMFLRHLGKGQEITRFAQAFFFGIRSNYNTK